MRFLVAEYSRAGDGGKVWVRPYNWWSIASGWLYVGPPSAQLLVNEDLFAALAQQHRYQVACGPAPPAAGDDEAPIRPDEMD